MNKRKRVHSKSKACDSLVDEVDIVQSMAKYFAEENSPEKSSRLSVSEAEYHVYTDSEGAETHVHKNKGILMFSIEYENKDPVFFVGNAHHFSELYFKQLDANRLIEATKITEVLFDLKPMKLFCSAEYNEAENANTDLQQMIEALITYIRIALCSLTNSVNLCQLLIEPFQKNGRVVVNVKTSDSIGAVNSMDHQRNFWSRVLTLAQQDLMDQKSTRHWMAKRLRVHRTKGDKIEEDWVLNTAIYRHRFQLECFDKALVCNIQDENFPLLLNKNAVKQKTCDDWSNSFVMNVVSDRPLLMIPDGLIREITSTNYRSLDLLKDGDGKDQIFQMDSSSFGSSISTLLQDVDNKWYLRNPSDAQIDAIYNDKIIDILPREVLLTLRSEYCPIHKDDNGVCSSFIRVGQDGSLSVRCSNATSYGNPEGINFTIHSLQSRARDYLLQRIWGSKSWISVLNKQFACLRQAIANKQIVEFYIDKGEFHLEFYSYNYLKNFYSNCTAYSVETESPDKSTLKMDNPIVCWHSSNLRRNFDQIVFDPSYRGKQNLNTWLGYSVFPRKTENPCPLTRQHIKEVLVSNDENHYDYLINWMAHLIQYPHIKTKVAPAFVSEQGSGKSFLAELLMRILGPHSMQIIDQQHFFGKFNGFLQNKVLIILNESTWSGDKRNEGQLKSYITDAESTMQDKFQQVKQNTNYLNIMFLSNNESCFPATRDNRRIFCPKVSNHRVGDYQYFNQLYGEYNNGGAESFLSYLQNHSIPKGWTPSEYLPRQTAGILKALLNDRSNIELQWLITKLNGKGWKADIKQEYRGGFRTKELTIIHYNQESIVSSEELMEAWFSERHSDKDLRRYSKIRNIKNLKSFFCKWLCGKGKNLFEDITIKGPLGNKVRGYRFASVLDIRELLNAEWGINDWDNVDNRNCRERDEDSCPPTKKQKLSKCERDVFNYLANEDPIFAREYAKQLYGSDSMITGNDITDTDNMSVDYLNSRESADYDFEDSEREDQEIKST